MTYAERTQKLSKLEHAKQNSKWATRRPSGEDAVKKVSEERRRLWNALNEYIAQHGGSVTSAPLLSPLRVEIRADSALPDKLAEFGYAPVHRRQTTRVTSDGIRNVDLIEIDLPR
jgi:hypothetical protein